MANLPDDLVSPQAIAADIARELREHPERWTQGALSKSATGRSLMNKGECWNYPDAACWCLIGHILKRTGRERDEPVRQRFREALGVKASDGLDLANWNDAVGRTVRDIIEACDKVALS